MAINNKKNLNNIIIIIYMNLFIVRSPLKFGEKLKILNFLQIF
jgi:hypothetical protein